MEGQHLLTYILLIILVCLLANVLMIKRKPAQGRQTSPSLVLTSMRSGGGVASGRKARALESKNIVVDTLNLVHWLKRRSPLKRVETCDILAAIGTTAPILHQKYSGRIIYVTKDRETRAAKSDAERLRALFQTTAHHYNVYIYVVERLPVEKKVERRDGKDKSHAALGRDDFYLIMLAWKYNCPALSQDRFRDLADMKTDLAPFHVYSFSPVKPYPERDFVNPSAAEFRRMQRPAAVDYSKVFVHL
ncbi:hypothetical protein ElyMa_002511400 [Elysia marginata]|uniref:PIN domain-containing protein n=1 Tax=Elysia marginata TaxID=1093978 RepID=A0AAV4GR17_9GAST|nr:hypothetical protein ElyMa_002511400 [Elysia marginata]